MARVPARRCYALHPEGRRKKTSMSISLTLDQLETEALKLPEESRIKLFRTLLHSFERALKALNLDDGTARAWAEEAERRAQAMEDGSEPEIPAEEVFARV